MPLLRNWRRKLVTKSDDKRVPALRFKGFTDEWEQRKLNYFLTTSSQKNSQNIYNKFNVLSVSGKYGIVNQIKLQGRSFAGKSLTNYKIINKNDIVYTKSPIKSNPYGIIKTNKQDTGIVSTLYAVYHPTKFVFPNFVELYFSNELRLNKYLKPIVNIGAKHDMKVANDEVINYKVIFPKVNEQTTINELFLKVDKLITLQQRKLKLLKLLKKAILQNLFVDKSMPYLRFISFDKSWDIVKLTDVGKATGGTSIESEFTSIGGTHKVISIGSYKENHAYNDQGIRVNLNDKTTSGRIIGSVLLVPVDNVFVYNQRTERIEPNHKKFSSKFLYQYLNSPNIRNKIVSNAQGNTQIYVNWSSISKIKYLMPQKKEQDKISKLLFTLDFIINNQQLRIKKYEKFKQFLLQNMFI